MSIIQIIDRRDILGETVTAYGTPENPLFDPAEVAEWLDYRKDNISHMLAAVDEDEKVLTSVPTIASGDGYESKKQGNLRTKRWFLTEHGLHETLMLSKKPQAIEFKKRIKQMLRELRLHGMTATTTFLELSLADPEYAARLLMKLHAERQARQEPDTQVKAQQDAAACQPLVTGGEFDTGRIGNRISSRPADYQPFHLAKGRK
jgi:anti-repressor protein